MNTVINLIRQQNYPILSSLSCSQNPATVPHPLFIVVFTKSCQCTPSSVHGRVHKILPLYPILSSWPCSQHPATEAILNQYTSLHNLASHLFNNHCNISYTITRMSPKRCLPFGFFESQTQLLTKLNNCNRPERKKKNPLYFVDYRPTQYRRIFASRLKMVYHIRLSHMAHILVRWSTSEKRNFILRELHVKRTNIDNSNKHPAAFGALHLYHV